METPTTIHAFWFGDEPVDASTAGRQSALWWGKDSAVDAAMRTRFAPLLAAAEQLDAWRGTSLGALACILVTDQFPRNLYRGTPQSFAFDARARGLCKDQLAQGTDLALHPLERVFFYLPQEHSEDLDDQERSVALFEALAGDVAAAQRETFAGFADYARRHREVIRRFGRFPHRNAILGRTSSAEERAFLSEPGSSF
jgi:uncharacterized protein (DUF924 family)